MDNLAGYLIKVPESPVIVVGVGVECLTSPYVKFPPIPYLAHTWLGEGGEI